MKTGLCVLFGGRSVEHEISIISALQAIQNLDTEKYGIIPVYLTRNGRFYTGECLMDIENYKDADRLLKTAEEVILCRSKRARQLRFAPCGKRLSGKTRKLRIDIVLPVVHGTNVEDGALQGFLRTLQIPFAGPDVLASAIGMEKTAMKAILERKGIPVLPFIAFSSHMWNGEKETLISKIEEEIGYPVMIKPSNLGSSIGIRSANDRDELTEGIYYACRYSLTLMAEKKVTDVKEINCAVLGDHEGQQLSACERPISKDEILSFADKYLSDDAQKGMSGQTRELPAILDKETEDTIRAYARDTFIALGCSGVARIDFIIDKNDGRVYVNEINTIPGSLSFYLFEPLGKSYKELLDELIGLALKRERENMGIDYDYKTNILSLKGKRGIKK